jgi:hypothetical protein
VQEEEDMEDDDSNSNQNIGFYILFVLCRRRRIWKMMIPTAIKTTFWTVWSRHRVLLSVRYTYRLFLMPTSPCTGRYLQFYYISRLGDTKKVYFICVP